MGEDRGAEAAGHDQLRVAIGVALGAAFLGVLFYVTARSTGTRCEVCIEYRGRTECRSALAADRDTARSQAVGDACATLSSGVTDGIQCNAQEPLQMTCTP